MKKGQRDRSLLTCSKWDTCSRHPERTAVGSDRPKGTKDFGASLEAAFSSTGKRNLPWALLPDAEMATEIPFLPEDATNDAERGLSERYPAQYLWFCLADKIPHVILATEKIFHFSAGLALSRLIHGLAPERQYKSPE